MSKQETERLLKVLDAVSHCLKSYAFGNAATGLAEEMIPEYERAIAEVRQLLEKAERVKTAVDEVVFAYGVFETLGLSGMPSKLKDWKELASAVSKLEKVCKEAT
jgi:hypothetical protein